MEEPTGQNMENILEVKGLKTHFFTEDGVVKAVDGVDLTVRSGEVLGLVGESGCGKSVTSLSIMGLIDHPGRIVEGSIHFHDQNLRKLTEAERGKIRGDRISMIFQQPQTFLNPIYKIGTQVAEVLRIHRGLDRQVAWERAEYLIGVVGIPEPERRVHSYPHEFSGGMAQRVMIAMALACEPELLIADEPTTALDVTIQAQILNLIGTLRSRIQSSVILITHDLGVVAEMANRVAVMYAGRVVEEAPVHELFAAPKHPYTQGLIASTPQLGSLKARLDVIPGSVPNPIDLPAGCKFAPRCTARVQFDLQICGELDPELAMINPSHNVRCWLYQNADHHIAPLASQISGASGELIAADTIAPEPIQTDHNALASAAPTARPKAEADKALVQVEQLVKYYPVQSGLLHRVRAHVHAVENISFSIREGETLGLVGESGCGKTTVGRSILRMIPATSGSVIFDGEEVLQADRQRLKHLRRHMQYIFQNPFASLNPRMTVGDSIAEGLLVHGMKDSEERKAIVVETLKSVGLDENSLDRHPHAFSGGQRQRIGVARALALRPRFLVCDEPVSALDVSIQSQVLNLLRDLQQEFSLTYLFIAHDLSVVEHISDRVAVMYLGKIVELADRDELYRNPTHPYTQALMAAIPIPDPTKKREVALLEGDVPSPINPPTGCRFHTRCPFAMEHCAEQEPEYKEISPGHFAACWLLE